MQILRKVDIFPKFDSSFEREARDRTLFGGFLSALSLICISLLLFSEVRFFFTIQKHHEIFVDGNSVAEPLSNKPKSSGGFFSSAEATNTQQELQIALNITFFEVPCDLMSVDAIDSFGEYVAGIEAHTTKRAVSRATGEHSADTQEHLTADGVGTKYNQEAAALEATAKKNEKRPGCGSCYGAELAPDDCCNTCEQVRDAYSRKGWSFSPSDMSITQCGIERLKRTMALSNHEGCNIVVDTKVARVQGNLHLIPGRAFSHLGQHLHDLGGEEIKALSLRHRINSLSFGPDYPGRKSPLDGVVGAGSDHVDAPDTFGLKDPQLLQKAKEDERAADKTKNGAAGATAAKDQQQHPWGGGKFSYYIKVVPTQYVETSGYQHDSFDYAVTSHFSAGTAGPGGAGGGGPTMITQIPGVFLQYDLTPIVNRVVETRPYSSVIHLLLNLAAICGGIFTVTSLIDAFVYQTSEILRKQSLGKQS